jgi:hypothetical protein
VRRASEAPPALLASVVAAGLHRIGVIAFARRLVAFQRRRVLRRRHHLLGVPTLQRHLVLWGIGIVGYVVLSVLLLKGSRVVWWLRVVAVCAGLLPLLRPPHDAVLLSLFVPLVAELALLLSPSARAYVRQPPR